MEAYKLQSTSNFRISENMSVLDEILETGINVVSWERKPILDITTYLKDPLWKSFNEWEMYLKGPQMLPHLIEDLKKHLPVYGEEKNPLIEDIEILIKKSFSLEPHNPLHIQFSKVENGMCRLFHVDHLRLRLLCSYRGDGTQWLENTNVNRKGLGKGCNHKIIKDAMEIRTAKAYDVIFLKGEKFPRNEKNGVVHRSPPLHSPDKWRLLLKIDSGKDW